MSYKEPEVMRKLHEIREKQHEETKNLTPEERVKKINDEAEACKNKFGLKLSMRVKVIK